MTTIIVSGLQDVYQRHENEIRISMDAGIAKEIAKIEEQEAIDMLWCSLLYHLTTPPGEWEDAE